MTTTQRGKTFKDLVTEAKTRINEVSQEEFKEWHANNEDMVIIDVRESHNYSEGCIDRAISLSRGILELEIDEIVPNQDAKIVAYCGGGSRSALAADTLQVMGYNNVYSLAGGWRQWNNQGE